MFMKGMKEVLTDYDPLFKNEKYRETTEEILKLKNELYENISDTEIKKVEKLTDLYVLLECVATDLYFDIGCNASDFLGKISR